MEDRFAEARALGTALGNAAVRIAEGSGMSMTDLLDRATENAAEAFDALSTHRRPVVNTSDDRTEIARALADLKEAAADCERILARL
jgi:predicted homoserine dehydrogenase-like protein